MHNGEKTPLIRLAKRESMPAAAQWGIRIAATCWPWWWAAW